MRIYAYGARPPIENAQMVAEQFRLGHAYQCALIAIERHRRTVIDRLYRRKCPAEWRAYAAADRAEDAAFERVRQSRDTGGEKLKPDDDMKREQRAHFKLVTAELEAAREQQKITLQAWKDAKKRATPILRPLLKECDRRAKEKATRAYNLGKTVGLAWGTRLKIGESVERAAKMSAKIGKLPKFPRYDGTGIVSVQLQGESGFEYPLRGIPYDFQPQMGLSAADALSGQDTRFRLGIVSPGAWQAAQGRSSLVGQGNPKKPLSPLVLNGPREGQPRRPLEQPNPNSRRSQRHQASGGAVGIARLRIASEGPGDRIPIWGTWPIILPLDRPLPKDEPIKWAQIHARKIGPRTEWRLLITVEEKEPRLRSTGLTLAVNLGWRTLPDGGLRVAYAVGSDGYEEEVRVPPDYVSGVAHVESLQAIRDQRFEALKKDLGEWIEEGERPAWLTDAVRYMDQWKSQKHAAWLRRDWGLRRFAGDQAVFDALVAWVEKDRELWFWESDEREKLLRMRKDFYRCVAARWAAKYARILVTDMDLRDFAKLAEPEEGAKSKDKVLRVSQRMAAPSVMRSAIENACSTRHSVFEEILGVDKTRTCNACGLVRAFDARHKLEHTCECGKRRDQDANHDLNLLADAEKRPWALAVKKKQSRWSKKKMKVVSAASAAPSDG